MHLTRVAECARCYPPPVELSQGESLIWEGRPSWRAMLAYYVKWGVLALLPAVVVAILNAVFDTDLPLGLAILATAIRSCSCWVSAG